MNWKPISTAPQDGSLVVCWKADWQRPRFLHWKENPRTARRYFGDPDENDDYELAERGPTHWHPLELPPKRGSADVPRGTLLTLSLLMR
jgi:hypothetical protein